VLTPFSQRVLATVMVRVGFLFTAIAVPSLLVTIVKRMIGRARPYVGGSLDPLLFDPFKWVPAYAGMPSGHATTAFAVLVAFGTLWPRARTMLLVYALLIVVSRVVLVALSFRCAGGGAGRHHRGGFGPPLFRLAPSWLHDPDRMAAFINIRDHL
jgi:membrane-associated PAP2 superfamily phosphatase